MNYVFQTAPEMENAMSDKDKVIASLKQAIAKKDKRLTKVLDSYLIFQEMGDSYVTLENEI